jgi:hypothetical protein
MLDQPSVHVGENTPEYVAFRLLERIAMVENRGFNAGGADRDWILDTYAECLLAVQNPSERIRTSDQGARPRTGGPQESLSRTGERARRNVTSATE